MLQYHPLGLFVVVLDPAPPSRETNSTTRLDGPHASAGATSASRKVIQKASTYG